MSTHPPVTLCQLLRSSRVARAVQALALLIAAALIPAPARAGGDVGEPAPEFTAENLQDTAPDYFQLSDYRGSVVVIEFFAHW